MRSDKVVVTTNKPQSDCKVMKSVEKLSIGGNTNYLIGDATQQKLVMELIQ